MDLQIIWFVLIAVLWIGFFVLEGFDFGVGMLLNVVGKTEAEKRAVLTTLALFPLVPLVPVVPLVPLLPAVPLVPAVPGL